VNAEIRYCFIGVPDVLRKKAVKGGDLFCLVTVELVQLQGGGKRIDVIMTLHAGLSAAPFTFSIVQDNTLMPIGNTGEHISVEEVSGVTIVFDLATISKYPTDDDPE
jgi:hypothetical protein